MSNICQIWNASYTFQIGMNGHSQNQIKLIFNAAFLQDTGNFLY